MFKCSSTEHNEINSHANFPICFIYRTAHIQLHICHPISAIVNFKLRVRFYFVLKNKNCVWKPILWGWTTAEGSWLCCSLDTENTVNWPTRHYFSPNVGPEMYFKQCIHSCKNQYRTIRLFIARMYSSFLL